MRNFVDLLKHADSETQTLQLDIELFKLALAEVDSQMKNLPATAQVQLLSSPYFFLSFLFYSTNIYMCCKWQRWLLNKVNISPTVSIAWMSAKRIPKVL